MSAATQITSQQLRKADDSVSGWLLGLVDGKGDSPSQIIVTAVLGCVPVVGQLFDLRDLIRCIIALATPGAGVFAWVELVITLVGCIPGFGDAIKAGLTLARKGGGAARAFDAMRGFAAFDPEKMLRQLDWSHIAKESRRLLDEMLDGFIDALDGWVVSWALGRQRVRELTRTLKDIKRSAPQKINEAIGELRKTVDEMLAGPKVKSTAEVQPTQRELAPARKEGGSHGKDQASDKTGDLPAQRSVRNSAEIRQAKRNRWATGAPAEHIVDYHTREKTPALRKINNHGRLIEEWERHRKIDDVLNRSSGVASHGFDHLWFGNHHGRKYTVGETKGSTWASFSFLAAMSEQDRAAVEATKTDTADILDPKRGDYDPDKPISADLPTSGTVELKDEGALSDPSKKTGTLPETKTKGRQMSHKWVLGSLQEDNSISAAQKTVLIKKILLARRSMTLAYPYNREVFMVTGKQYEQHDRAKGRVHKIQPPVIRIPDTILED